MMLSFSCLKVFCIIIIFDTNLILFLSISASNYCDFNNFYFFTYFFLTDFLCYWKKNEMNKMKDAEKVKGKNRKELTFPEFIFSRVFDLLNSGFLWITEFFNFIEIVFVKFIVFLKIFSYFNKMVQHFYYFFRHKWYGPSKKHPWSGEVSKDVKCNWIVIYWVYYSVLIFLQNKYFIF